MISAVNLLLVIRAVKGPERETLVRGSYDEDVFKTYPFLLLKGGNKLAK